MVMGRVADEGLALVWERRIERQRRSRLSIAEFCSQEGVSPAAFYAWRRRLRGADSAGPQSTLFVPVELPTPGIAAGGVRLELPGGTVLSLPADASMELMTAAIRAVMSSVGAAERPSC
jgi:Transposase